VRAAVVRIPMYRSAKPLLCGSLLAVDVVRMALWLQTGLRALRALSRSL
jgi:hypothetical protein